MTRNESSCERVLITGVTGMIGANVAAVLLRQPQAPLGGVTLPCVQLFGLARYRSDQRMLQSLVPLEGALTLLRGDVNDPLSVHRAVQASRPAVVFHFAAQAYNGVSWGAPSLTMETNVVGTVHLLEALRAAGLGSSRVLMAASSAQYGDGIAHLADPASPFPETTPQLPLSPYGVSKAAMELVGRQYWRNFGMPILFARLFPQAHASPTQPEGRRAAGG
jgi:GDP-4-dehydro-6-deoxy-D-mannose reductase